MDLLAVLVTSYPKGGDPCFTERGKKSLPDSTAQFQFDHVLLVTCWALTHLLTQSLRNENWQTSLERAHDSALTEQHQPAEQCLFFWQLTWCCDLFPCAGARRDLRQEAQMGQGEAATCCHEKAIPNNLSGIRKVTLCSKRSHHWQQFFPTSVKEEKICSWSLCHH